MNRLKETDYASFFNISDLDRKLRTILKEINDLKISMKKYVTIKLINCLSSEFETYVIVLNEQARKNKKLSELNELLKSLKEEENRMKGTATVAAVRSEREGYRDRGGRGYPDRSNSGKDDGSGRSYCKICFQNHEGKCHHAKMKCYKCHKSGHIARNCPDNRKDAESTSSTSQRSESESTERKQVIGMVRNNIAQFSPNGNIEFIG